VIVRQVEHVGRETVEGYTRKGFLFFKIPSFNSTSFSADVAVAYASRAELAEASANILMKGGYKNEIVLLTGPNAAVLAEMVGTNNQVTGEMVANEKVTIEEHAAVSARGGEGGNRSHVSKRGLDGIGILVKRIAAL